MYRFQSSLAFTYEKLFEETSAVNALFWYTFFRNELHAEKPLQIVFCRRKRTPGKRVSSTAEREEEAGLKTFFPANLHRLD